MPPRAIKSCHFVAVMSDGREFKILVDQNSEENVLQTVCEKLIILFEALTLLMLPFGF